MSSESDRIEKVYEQRKSDPVVMANNRNYFFNHFMECERELHYGKLLRGKFHNLPALRVLEVGAGGGVNIHFFLKAGILPQNMVINELLPERQKILETRFPGIRLHKGDAGEMTTSEFGSFDLIFQSLVFTSILNSNVKINLASQLWKLLKPGGAILWYDFIYDNPGNSNVKGIKLLELKQLFPDAISCKGVRVTLAPPIGRRVGSLYPLFNMLAFLRTHRIVLIEKAV